MSLKNWFAQLDGKVLDSDRTALSQFSQLSITIPDQVMDVALFKEYDSSECYGRRGECIKSHCHATVQKHLICNTHLISNSQISASKTR
jgi:hypothetical protein